MKNYYFTFGSGQITKGGRNLQDGWIRVRAESYGKARQVFMDQFTSIEMNRPTEFAFQYEEGDFDKTYFPDGEYLLINQNSI